MDSVNFMEEEESFLEAVEGFVDSTVGVRLPKIYLRDLENPMSLPETKFKKRYRFTQQSVVYITSLIADGLRSPERAGDNRGLPVSPEMAVLLCLRFYATGSFQIVCGDLCHLSQATACNVIVKVSQLLANLLRRFIKFPRGADAVQNRQLFKEMGGHGIWPGLTGVDGAIDCTHIRLVNTPGCEHHEVFRNRKAYFSLNVQMVVGPRTEILDIVARWAGSTHDSRIFQMSSLYTKYSTGVQQGRLVGDSGYPSLPFLLTPVRDPVDPPSIRYNRAQIKTRNVVERAFGILKRRFPCLSRGLGNKLVNVSNIIVSCAVLHNLSLILNDMISFEPDDVLEPEVNNSDSLIASTSSGLIVRTSIIENFYC